jgi:hypothetical protein
MNWFSRARSIFGMAIAFRHCGLLNAWRMAMQTRVVVVSPLVADEISTLIEGEVVDDAILYYLPAGLQPHGLLPAPKEER